MTMIETIEGTKEIRTIITNSSSNIFLKSRKLSDKSLLNKKNVWLSRIERERED